MAKTKTPFLSLGAQGTIGRAVTSQKRGGATLLRWEPLPPYRYTLPQAYQRWLYQDYAYLWRQQSTATRQTYATAGVRFHLTGFQYWMKYHLTTLPDILAWWKLDIATGAIAYDSSKNANTLSIIGASPATGRIARCLYFDGINDRCTHATFLDAFPTTFTIELWFNSQGNTGAVRYLFAKENVLASDRVLLTIDPTERVRLFTEGNNLGNRFCFSAPIAQNTFYHLVATIDPGNPLKLSLNNIETTGNVADAIGPGTFSDFFLGISRLLTNPFKGLIDDYTIRNRTLDTAEILSHSLRRYPP